MSPSPDNNFVSANPSESAVGTVGAAVGDGIVPNGVSVLTMTSGGGKSEVGVLMTSTLATIDGGAASPSTGPGVPCGVICSASGLEVSSSSSSSSSSVPSSGSGV